MTTGNKHWIISSTRLAASSDFKDRLQSPLRADLESATEKVYPDDGVFVTKLQLAALTDAFAITGTSEATDGNGKILDNSLATDPATSVPFENTIAIVYDVGLRVVERPIGIQINPRTGKPEYIEDLEDIGEQGDPTSVVDNGPDITFNINNLLESGVDHSGRTAVVYLKVPAEGGTTEAIAIETATVAYAAPNNTITTTGLLGQSSPVSTTPADYEVVVLGPTVRRNTDLTLVDGIVFIGQVTGGGAGNPATAVDITLQNLIDVSLSGFNNVLDAFISEVDISVASLTKPITGERMVMSTGVQDTDAVFHGTSIYVMGGSNSASAEVNVNQALDKATNIWTVRAPVPSQSNGGPAADGRLEARMVVIGDAIYYIGGIDGGTYVELVQRYQALTDTWDTARADLPAARAGGAIGAINGKIYYAGGAEVAGGGGGRDNTYEYDPVGDMWTEVASIATVLATNATLQSHAVIKNKLYVFGGVQPSGPNQTARSFVYDPAVDTWLQLTDIPRADAANNTGAHNLAAGAVVNDVFHLFGGNWLGSQSHGRFHMMYNADTDDWTTTDAPGWGGAEAHGCAADDDGLIYLCGGEVHENDSTLLAVEGVDRVSAYDASQIFLASRPGIASTTGVKAEQLALNQAPYAATSVYTGNALPVMPTEPRYACRAAVQDGLIYVSGGIDDLGAWSDALEVYSPESNTWTALADMIEPRSHHNFTSDPRSASSLWLWHGLSSASAERDEVYQYEIPQNDWRLADSAMSIFTARSAYAQVGNKLITVGGHDGVGTDLDAMTIYDINSQTVTTGPIIPNTVRDAAMVALANEDLQQESSQDPSQGASGYSLYFCCGFDGISYLDNMYIFNSVENAWVAQGVGTFFNARSRHGAVLVEQGNGDKAINVVGGRDAAAVVINQSGTRISGPFTGGGGSGDLLVGRSNPAVAVVDGIIYVIGGSDFAIATVFDTMEAQGTPHVKEQLLQNFTAQKFDFGQNVQRPRRDERQTVAFRAGHLWGVGTWSPHQAIDLVKIGE